MIKTPVVTLLQQFQKAITAQQLTLGTKRTLLAVSGGMDSMVLADLFHQCQFPFAIGHCNFQLRGAESNGDEELVRDTAARYQVPFYTIRFDTIAYKEAHQVSTQVAARELRYEWFESLRATHKYHYIATAHHLSDNIETVLHNWIKGTGIKGLRGMLPRQGLLIRPLLAIAQSDIAAYQQEHKIAYREDSSNASDHYTRNKLRHQLLPLIEEINPGFEAGMIERIKVMTDLERLYERKMARLHKLLFEPRGGDIYISIALLRKQPIRRSLLYEYLHPHGFTASQVDDILSSLEAEAGKQFLSPTARLIRDRTHLILTRAEQRAFTQVLVNRSDTTIKLPTAQIEMRIVPAAELKMNKSADYAYLDMAKISWPCTLRQWRLGDYFYPYGMKLKKKKVSKYFKDQKIPIHEKSQIWILETDKKVAWIVGERSDERLKVTAATTEVLVLKQHKNME